MIPLILIAGNLTGLTSSTVFFLRYVSTDLEGSLYALFQIGGQLGMTNAAMVTFLSRHKLQTMFENLKNIYNAHAMDESFVYLTQANNQAEWILKMYAMFMLFVSVSSLILIPTISIAFCLMTHGSFDVEHVYHPFKVVLPWVQYTKLGYFYELIFDLIVANGYLFASGLLFILFISLCLFHPAFYEMFKHLVQKLYGEKGQNRSKWLCELIRFHMSVKSWFIESSDVYSPYILVQLISFMVFLACNVFQLDLMFGHIVTNFDFSITMLMPITIITTLTLLLYCYFAKMATESFLNMGNYLFESDWQNLPVDSQKYLILMIASMQRPLYYHGYGIAVLNLETFAKCIKTVLSYYMMFKTLTKN